MFQLRLMANIKNPKPIPCEKIKRKRRSCSHLFDAKKISFQGMRFLRII